MLNYTMDNSKDVKHKIGDKVIALTNPPSERSQPRTKGQEYEVLDVKYCSKCGIQSINVAGIASSMFNNATDCGCGHTIPSKLWWTESRLFASRQELEALKEKAIELERYEDAQALHNLGI